MISAKRLALPLVIVAATALLAGCGGSVEIGGSDINADEAAQTIKDEYANQIGLKLTEITCDSGKPEVGAKFSCDAKNEADLTLEIEATVTKVNEDTDKADFDWTIAKATAGPTTFTSTALDALQSVGRAVDSIECPGGTVMEKGNTIECVGTMDDGSKRRVKITLTDGNGQIHVDLLGLAQPTGE
ncbi:MAG: DUF4333 domain-containing protein [Thermoleophilia bacterium]|nr:DUF4333 domain-containing protein [Thermoleophilia bacterium]